MKNYQIPFFSSIFEISEFEILIVDFLDFYEKRFAIFNFSHFKIQKSIYFKCKTLLQSSNTGLFFLDFSGFKIRNFLDFQKKYFEIFFWTFFSPSNFDFLEFEIFSIFMKIRLCKFQIFTDFFPWCSRLQNLKCLSKLLGNAHFQFALGWFPVKLQTNFILTSDRNEWVVNNIWRMYSRIIFMHVFLIKKNEFSNFELFFVDIPDLKFKVF